MRELTTSFTADSAISLLIGSPLLGGRAQLCVAGEVPQAMENCERKLDTSAQFIIHLAFLAMLLKRARTGCEPSALS